MIVSNPLRATQGPGVGVEDFPGLPVTSVTWTRDDAGELALDVATSRPLTVDEQATVDAVCQSASDDERINRDKARAAMRGLATIAGSSGDLTSAQLSDAVRLMAKVLLALIRIALRLKG